jgi:hypothetical protein
VISCAFSSQEMCFTTSSIYETICTTGTILSVWSDEWHMRGCFFTITSPCPPCPPRVATLSGALHDTFDTLAPWSNALVKCECQRLLASSLSTPLSPGGRGDSRDAVHGSQPVEESEKPGASSLPIRPRDAKLSPSSCAARRVLWFSRWDDTSLNLKHMANAPSTVLSFLSFFHCCSCCCCRRLLRR